MPVSRKQHDYCSHPETERTAAQRAAEVVMSESNWTPDRPTKPGEYWLAVHPDQRGLCLDEGVYKVEVREANHVYHHRGMTRFSDERLGGALWAPRETPADPFEEVAT